MTRQIGEKVKSFLNMQGGKALCIVLLLVVVPSLYYGLALKAYGGTYSIYDEQTHMGYAWSVSHGEIPARGDLLPDEILDDLSCSGWRSISDKIANTPNLPACGADTSAEQSLGAGEQYNYFHPPLYYAITGFLARLVSMLYSEISFAQAARAVSVIWMVAGLLAMYAALRKWQVNFSCSLAVCSLVPYIPIFLNTGTAVTNDAPGLLCGAGMLWLAARFFREKNYHLLIPLIIVVFSCMIKGTFAFSIFALCFILVLHGLIDFVKANQRRTAVKEMVAACACVFVALVCVFGWRFIQSHRGDASYVPAITGTSTAPVEGLPIGEFLNTLMSSFDLSTSPGSLRGLDASVGYSGWLSLLQIVMLGAAFFLYFQNDGVCSHKLLVYSTIFGLLLSPALVQIMQYMGDRSMFVNVNIRYSIMMVPFVLCCWALTVQNRKQPWIAWCVSGIGFIVCFVSVLGLAPL
ncbi:glycosyltransferase family 39 protein [Bifidobacterium eulemuris]|uniref:Glycosyltransferase family 39 protein n=1 Tax=Bifidobacterium eulemuris TaxID=1765219 RepID=A0A261FYU9_9BIFI|nr:glycosyltransferase family 39 protein [Bifidobacterium eulemuris]OZG64361.1 hypothetical protein BEUL_2192 [Bifidobacterium eulemuris]QOL32438.1 glycosyltransferase family 39 protein [Bifidobacterium eulemuris]